MILFHFKVI